MAAFASEATGFSDYFPGIKPHLLTLGEYHAGLGGVGASGYTTSMTHLLMHSLTSDSNFNIPFYREILMWLGICSVSKTSCRNILAKGPGYAITIVVGGAAESLAAHPGTQDLTLKKRFGFVKVAIREGAQLVPVFSFGENDVSRELKD